MKQIGKMSKRWKMSNAGPPCLNKQHQRRMIVNHSQVVRCSSSRKMDENLSSYPSIGSTEIAKSRHLIPRHCYVRRRQYSQSIFGQESIDEDTDDSVTDDISKSHGTTRRSPPVEVSLDKFTHYCLNSNMIPLGTMKHDTILEAQQTIHGWLEIGSGFAIDSADRLLKRLWVEYFVSTSSKQRQFALDTLEWQLDLLELQRDVFYAWMDCAFSAQRIKSDLALEKTEHTFVRLQNIKKTLFSINDGGKVDNVNSDVFPIDEYISLVRACINLIDDSQQNQEKGAEKAAELLTSYCLPDNSRFDQIKDVDMSVFADMIGPLLEECVVILLTLNQKSDIAVDFLETMAVLKDSGRWPALSLPHEAERILLESSLQRSEEEHKQTGRKSRISKKPSTLTPYEKETMEKRLIEMLNKDGADDREEMENLIERSAKIEPGAELVSALVVYYTRLQDVEKASLWLQQVESSSLMTSPEILDDLLLLWSKQKGQRIPWRADELFNSIANRLHDHSSDTVPIALPSFKIMLDMWATSEDPAAERKILDLYANMVGWKVQSDGETLRLAVSAAQKEKSLPMLELVSLDVLEQWDSLQFEEKVWLSEEIMTAIAAVGGEFSNTVTSLVDRFRVDNIKPTPAVYRSALEAIRPESSTVQDVWKIVNSFENGLDQIDLSLYALAIHRLFKFDDGVEEAHALIDNVFGVLEASVNGLEPDSIASFLENVVRMLVSLKMYPAAGTFVRRAETLLFPSTGKPEGHLRPLIPLACYKLLIVRNWYTTKSAPIVMQTFDHLLELHKSGYPGLQPDCETYTGYMRACATMEDDVEPILHHMIDMYEKFQDPSLKPTVESFNVVLLAYSRLNAKKSQAGNKSVNMIKLMVTLGVAPNTKSVNLALYSIVKGGNQYAFSMTQRLLELLEQNNCKPEANAYTLHHILDACAGDGTTNSDIALKKCLSTFREIRENEMIGPTTYGVLSKVLCQLLTKGDRTDKVAGSILALCCRDGRLTSEVRERFQAIMSRPAWIVEYERKLINGEEPPEWSGKGSLQSD